MPFPPFAMNQAHRAPKNEPCRKFHKVDDDFDRLQPRRGPKAARRVLLVSVGLEERRIEGRKVEVRKVASVDLPRIDLLVVRVLKYL